MKGEHHLDIEYFISVFSRREFAHVKLCAVSRARLIELVSRLACNGQLTSENLARFIPPLLAPFSSDWERHKFDVRREIAKAEQVGGTNEGNRWLRNAMAAMRVLVILAAILLMIIGPLAYYLKIDRENLSPAIAAFVPDFLAAGQDLDPLAPQQFDEKLIELELLDAAAQGGITATEAALAFPSLYWLPRAVEDQGWQADTPMPLNNMAFTAAVIQFADENSYGLEHAEDSDQNPKRPATLEQQVVAVASQTAETSLLRRMREICPDAAEWPVSRAVGQLSATESNDVLSAAEYHAYLKEMLAELQCASSDDRKMLSSTTAETLARALAMASYEFDYEFEISNAPWQALAVKGIQVPKWFFATIFLIFCTIASTMAAMKLPFFIGRKGGDGDNAQPLRLREISEDVLDKAWATPWLRALGRKDGDVFKLDITKSVRATARSSGFLKLHYRKQPYSPPYGVAIERQSSNDGFSQWWNRAFTRLAQMGANVRLIPFRSSVALSNLKSSARAHVSKHKTNLKSKFLIFADTNQDAVTGIFDDVRLRSPPIILVAPKPAQDPKVTPAGRQSDDIQELASTLARLSGYGSTAEDAAEHIFDKGNHWLDETPLSEGDWVTLRSALYLFLGQSGFRWLCASALYPTLSEPIAWHVHGALRLEPLQAPQLAARLLALPWFRAGFIPLHLRKRLLGWLDLEDITHLRESFIESTVTGDQEQVEQHIPRISTSRDEEVDLEDSLIMSTLLAVPSMPSFFSSEFDKKVRELIAPSILKRLTDIRLFGILGGSIILAMLIFWVTPDNISFDLEQYISLEKLSLSLSLVVLFVAGLFFVPRVPDLIDRSVYSIRYQIRGAFSTSQQLPTDRTSAPSKVYLLSTRSRLLAVARGRFLWVGFTFLWVGLACLARLAWLGFMTTASMSASLDDALLPTRGMIVDRNGTTLASDFREYALWFNPRAMADGGPPLVNSVEDVATGLKSIFPDLDYLEIVKTLESGRPGYIKRTVLLEDTQKIMALGEPALEIPRETRRIYPEGSLASHALGFVDRDGRGRSGMEAYFDSRLNDPELRGTSAIISIDLRVQGALEEELRKGIDSTDAVGGAGIILDVDSGEILALTSLPDFSPNEITVASADKLFNRATNQVYEMGNVFIPITAAAAIDSGVITGAPDVLFPSSPIQIAGFTIQASTPSRQNPNLAQVVMDGSSTASARIADNVGSQRLRAYLTGLYMHLPPKVELPARGTPIWPGDDWSRLSTMTAGYGHGIAVTPLHVASAYATMVNGGNWRAPTLLKQEQSTSEQGGRVFKASTSTTVRQLLRLNVLTGTGRQADAVGYRVGGKSGSVEKPSNGGYSNARLVSTFVGAFPMDRPRYVVLVMLDEPKESAEAGIQRTAQSTAASIVGRLIPSIGPLLGLAPDRTRDIDVSGLQDTQN